MIPYGIGSSGETVRLADEVLAHLEAHRQMKLWHREAGGLLFARISGKEIRIEAITGPRTTDRRTPFSYWPDRKAEQAEIDAHHAQGLHYVGDWHSHPEDVPSPSRRDERTMASRVLQSEHQLNGILFAIIGRSPLPEGLTLVVHDGLDWHRLARRSGARVTAAATARD